MQPHIIMGSALVATLTSGAAAQFAGTEDRREVVASAEMLVLAPADGEVLIADADQASPAPGFAAFASSRLATGLYSTTDWVQALATQDSSFTPTRLDASGVVEAQINVGAAALAQPGVATASSVYAVRFAVEETSFISLCAVIESESPSDGAGTASTASVSVNREYDGEFIPYFSYDIGVLNDPAAPYYFNIHLDPGEWEVVFEVSATATALTGNPGQAEGAYWGFVEYLGEPCGRADVAPPVGVLDLTDLTSWVGGYFSANYIYNPTYDICRDGLFDICDISAFITAFQQGCTE